MVRAYYYQDSQEPFTEPHDSGISVPLDALPKLGVIYHRLETLQQVDQLAHERNYQNRDIVKLNQKDTADLNGKLSNFFNEHLHEDEEIRYIMDGSGYFDVRDNNDRWIRVLLNKYDLLILPAGIYHRFTLTSAMDITALRLFQTDPKWTALQRNESLESSCPCRKEYLASIC